MPIDWRRLFGLGGRRAASVPPAGQEPANARAFVPPWSADDEVLANLAIGHLRDNLIGMLKNDRGVHAETLMVLIGVVAGHAAALAAQSAPAKPGRSALMSVTAADGKTYYFGDPINAFLVPEDPDTPSLWAFVSPAVLQAGVPAADLPDIDRIFAEATRNIGTAAFGRLSISDEHKPMWPPRETLDALWPLVRNFLAWTEAPGANGRALPVAYWPIVASIVAQQFIGMTKDVLDPRLSARLIMESAIFMSKVDPKAVPQKVPTTG